MRIISAYAGWTRRQAGTVNCGHYAVLAAVAAGIAAMLIAQSPAAALAVTAAAVFTLCAAAAGYAAWRLTRRPAVPRCHDCGTARAAGVVRFANGVRSDEVPLCSPCSAAARAALRTDHVLPWARPGRWDPCAAQLPAAPDNAAAVDPVTAQDLAAVLARARVRP